MNEEGAEHDGKVNDASVVARRDHSNDGAKDARLNAIVAVLVALSATFLAICNVKGANVVQAMGRGRIEIVDTWAFFQAKSTKQSLAESAAVQLAFLREAPVVSPDKAPSLDRELEGYRARISRYENEKNELKAKAEALERDYDRLRAKDDQLDVARAVLAIAIALFGITALTKKRWLLWLAGSFMGFGVLIGLAAFCGWDVRSDSLARILGA